MENNLLLFAELVQDNALESKINNTNRLRIAQRNAILTADKRTAERLKARKKAEKQAKIHKIFRGVKGFGMALAGMIGSAVALGAMVLFRLMF